MSMFSCEDCKLSSECDRTLSAIYRSSRWNAFAFTWRNATVI